MSRAEEIRTYFRELMEDGAEHGRTELFAYARQQNPGANFTEGMLTGALRTLVDGNGNYVCVSRGVYRLDSSRNVSNGDCIRELIKKYHEILRTAVEKMENEISVNPFLLLEAGETDVMKMRRIQKCIDTMKGTMEFIDRAQG